MADDLRHIALFVPSLQGGGAERAMVTLANTFTTRGLHVDLIVGEAEGPYVAEIGKPVRVVDLRAGRVLAALPALVRYLRREQPEVLLSAMAHANIVALLARDLARAPVRVVISERNVFARGVGEGRGFRNRLLPTLMRRLYPRADGILAVSGDVACDLRRLLGAEGRRVRVVYNPAVGRDLADRAREPVDDPCLAPGQPPLVLGAGRLTPQKDFPTLLRAFALVAARRPAGLAILGEGEQRSELAALARELGIDQALTMPGFVRNPFAYMSRAAVFVLSSRWEGLPNVLIQAMACGAPVVSTDCPGGSAEILEKGRWGRLVPVGDADALAEAIQVAIDEPAPPDVRQRAQDFGVDSAVDRYLALLRGN